MPESAGICRNPPESAEIRRNHAGIFEQALILRTTIKTLHIFYEYNNNFLLVTFKTDPHQSVTVNLTLLLSGPMLLLQHAIELNYTRRKSIFCQSEKSVSVRCVAAFRVDPHLTLTLTFLSD